jgi:hypothetical protein
VESEVCRRGGGKSGVDEAMRQTGVDQGQIGVGCEVGFQGDEKRVGVGKSGSVEACLFGCMDGFNAALSLCGGQRAADYFFASVASFGSDFVSIVLAARPLDAEDEDFGHSFAIWPVCPQKRQRLLLYRHFRSCCVSLPSFPILSDKSGIFFDDWPELCCFCPEVDRAVDFLSEVEGAVRFVFSGALSDLLPEVLLSREISVRHSQ